jgi:tetratricopeptide (TPR) repeat protein
VLVALDLATGQEAARISLAGQATPAAPRIGDGAAYLACRGPYLLAVGLDGGAGWRFDLEGEDAAWLDQTPLQVGDGLYCVSTTGTLVSLDSATGALRWNRAVGPPGKALTAPVTEDGRLFVGARDGVHALDLAGGEEWFFATGRKVSAAPAVADGVVYAAAHDHHLYALDAVSGKEWWRVELDRRIEVRPVVGDELVLAADREGHIAAVERILDAEGYAQRGLWPEAASAHIRAGRLAEAARICKEQLAQPRHAAELWRAAGDLARAAPLYVQAQAYERAEACYAQLGQPLRVAEMARRQGDLARAAALYRAEGAWREARDCYAEAGDRRAVAELSERLGEWPRAAQTWEALGEWARAGALERARGQFAAAAEAFMRAAQSPERASDRAALWSAAEGCCLQAGNEAQAAACRIEVARHRGQPYIELQVTAPERMVKDQFVLLACHLRNVGGARPARSLCATSPTILRASWNRPRRCATWRPARRCRLYSRSAHGSAARCRSRSMSITAIRRARWRASRTARGST